MCVTVGPMSHCHLPAGVLKDVTLDGRRHVAVVVSHAKVRPPHLVLVRYCSCSFKQLKLTCDKVNN